MPNFTNTMPVNNSLSKTQTVTSPLGFSTLTYGGANLYVTYPGGQSNIVGNLIGGNACTLGSTGLTINSTVPPNWTFPLTGPVKGLDVTDSGQVIAYNLAGQPTVIFTPPQ